jgi:hypothetical protein
MPDFGVHKEKDTLLVTVFPEWVMVGQTRLSP